MLGGKVLGTKCELLMNCGLNCVPIIECFGSIVKDPNCQPSVNYVSTSG